MAADPVDAPHYWYAADDRMPSARVLEALRAYRAAETAMRRRTRESMHMGESDLLALRYLLRAEREHRVVTPKDLADYLAISTASTSVLLNRLEKSGHIHRAPHPTDRRALVVTTTGASDDEVRATLGQMHTRMLEVASRLSADEAAVVTRFLDGMREAVDAIDVVPKPAEERRGGRES